MSGGRPVDVLSLKRAERMADGIRAYWRAQGYEVATWVEHTPFHHKMRTAVIVVRSDLVNGLPRGFRAAHRRAA